MLNKAQESVRSAFGGPGPTPDVSETPNNESEKGKMKSPLQR